MEVTGTTVEELKDKISNEEATIDGLKKQAAAAEKIFNGLKEEVATLQQSGPTRRATGDNYQKS